MARDSDSCIECLPSFILTDDRIKCLPEILDCATYSPSNRFSNTLNCSVCKTGLYIDQKTKTCVKGTVENCWIYDVRSNICVTCLNKFILQNGICVPQTTVAACDNYHFRSDSVCLNCKSSAIATRFAVKCLPVSLVPNCQVYYSQSICFRCQDGYMLINNSCKAINPAENCLQKKGDHCIKCLQAFINDNGVCKQGLDQIIINCNSTNLDGFSLYSQNKCNFCNVNSVPLNYADNFVCTENTYVASVSGAAVNPDCLQYKIIGGVYTCVKCVLNKFLNINDNTCITTCPTTLYRQMLVQREIIGNNRIDGLTVSLINACGPKITNCAIAVPDLNQNFLTNPRYACAQCDANKLPVIDSRLPSTILVKNSTVGAAVFGASPVSFYPGLNCVDITNNDPAIVIPIAANANNKILKRLGNFVSNALPNCDYYSVIEPGIGCVKCAHSFTGTVQQVVNQCLVYTTAFTCSKCVQGFYLAKPEECQAVTMITNCVSYSQTATSSICVKCSKDFFVAADGLSCTLRVKSRNVANSGVTDNADTVTCVTGYYLLPSDAQSTALYVCAQLPSNCITPTVTNNLISGCTACNTTTSYLVNNACVVGLIKNCIQYDQNDGHCTQCQNTFYVSNAGNCLAHEVSRNPNCMTFDQGTLNTCTACGPFSFQFAPQNTCKAILTIPNCKTYDSTTTCDTCYDGYRLANLRVACNIIPASENCIVQVPLNIVVENPPLITTADADYNREFLYTCSKCKPGFYKRSVSKSFTDVNSQTTQKTVNVCSNWFKYKFENCQSNNVDNPNVNVFTGGCASCQNNFYPIFFKQEYVCVERDYLGLQITDAKVTDCEIMDWVSGTFGCIKCKYPKVLTTGGTCAADCGANEIVKVKNFDFVVGPPDTFTFVEKEICEQNGITTVPAPASANCLKTTPAINFGEAVKYTCIACKPNFMPVYDLNGLGVQFDPLVSDKIYNVNDAYPTIQECLDVTNVKVLTSQAGNYVNSIPNCKYYRKLQVINTDIFVGCIVCNIGFQGKIKYYNGANELGFIPECLAMTTSGAGSCSPSSPLNYASGLGHSYLSANLQVLSLFYSCYKCGTASEIPAMAISFTTANNKKTFANIIQYDSTTPDKYRAAQLSNVISPQTFCTSIPNGLPANCGLMALNVDFDASVANSVRYFCTACAPGYTPTYQVTNGNTDYTTVTTCTSIANCNITASTYFNGCSNCVYYYNYITDMVDTSKCIPNATPDFIQSCFAGDDLGKCSICNKGFDMGPNGTCVKMTTPFCMTSSKSNPLKYFSMIVGKTQQNSGDILSSFGKISQYFLGEKLGCQECDPTAVITQVRPRAGEEGNPNSDPSVQQGICISKNMTLPKTYFIPNCTSIKIPDQVSDTPTYSCQICVSGFVLTDTGKCIPQNITKYLNNCLTSKTEGNVYHCTKCVDETTYINIGGMCVNKTTVDPNCVTFDTQNSPNNEKASCTTCASTYYKPQNADLCAPIPPSFPNCAELVYDNQNTVYNCNKCVYNFVLVTINSVKTCFPTKFPVQYDTNCLAYDAAQFVQRKLKCTTCADGYFAIDGVVNLPGYCSNFTLTPNPLCAEYDLPAHGGNDFGAAKFNCKSCVQKTVNFFDLKTNDCKPRINLDPNCQTYNDNADECNVCAETHFLEPKLKTTCLPLPGLVNFNPINKSYLQSCSVMTNCVATMFYEGLSKSVSSYLSCHSCNIAGQIPFLVGMGGWPFKGILGLQRYGLGVTLGNTTQRYMDFSGDASTRCLSPTSGALNIQTALFNFPTGCGVGFLNANANPDASHSNRLTDVDRTKIAAVCVACSPGYFATPARDTDGRVIQDMIAACTPIVNCTSSIWFNYCTQCNPNHSYGYNRTTGIRFDQCIINTANPNCYAVDNTNPTLLSCVYCNVGFVLNFDGICEPVRPPRCFNANYRSREYYPVIDLAAGLLLSKEGVGCPKCDAGFVGVYNEKPLFLCTQSSYISQNFVQKASQFIYQCYQYVVTPHGRLRCQVCNTGYVLSTDSSTCQPVDNIQNCQIAFDSKTCANCNPSNSVVVDSQCAQQSIPNCLRYSNIHIYSTPVCESCQPGFFLDANVCRPNPINFCDLSDGNRTCVNCAVGYIKVRSVRNTDYCVPVDPALNCTTLDPMALQAGKLVCKTCSNPMAQFISDQPDLTSFCMNVQVLDNCLVYNTSNIIGASTFECIQCTTNYFLTPGMKCQQRLVRDVNCNIFSLNADACVQCFSGFYLSPDGKTCVPFPKGISNCRVYALRTKCSACDPNFYLSSNECVAIQKNQLIPNCLYYADEKTCSQCQGAFAVVDGQCVPSAAQNCLTYITPTACGTCAPKFGLQEISGITHCVTNQLPSCDVATTISPFQCTTCSQNFYLSSGACLAVNATIPSCLIYATSNTCAQCSSGTALSADAKSCDQISSFSGLIDPNCQLSEIKPFKKCNICMPNHYFKNGACQRCSTGPNCYGCLDTDPTVCLLCAPGYYMNPNKDCVANGAALQLHEGDRHTTWNYLDPRNGDFLRA